MGPLPLVDLQRGVLPGIVAVICEHDPLGEVPHRREVLFPEGGATGGDGSRHPCLEEGDHIGVALADDDLIGLDDVLLRPVECIESPTLRVDRRLRRVLVLGLVALRRRCSGRRRKDASSYSDRTTTWIENREHNPCSEEVLGPTTLIDESEPRPFKDLRRGTEVAAQLIPIVGCPPESKLPDDVAAVSPASQVAPSRSGIRRVKEAVVEEVDRLRHRLEIGVAVLSVRSAPLVLVQCDARAVGQHPHGIDEREALSLLDELDGIPGDLATEALVVAGLGVDVERWSLLAVERTESRPVASDLLQANLLADERDEIRGFPDLVDLLARYRHGWKLPRRFVGGAGDHRLRRTAFLAGAFFVTFLVVAFLAGAFFEGAFLVTFLAGAFLAALLPVLAPCSRTA